MPQLQSMYTDLVSPLSGLTGLEMLDLLLVTLAFYLLLNQIRLSRMAFLFRGEVKTIVLLPLPTFAWLIQMALIAMLIATPVIFQPELRRLLERIGRSAGTQAVRQTTVENVLAQLAPAIERMSASHTGAIIALGGKSSLEHITETGIPIDGQVTGELLQAIFYPDNPLHDGAIILREDRLVAAGCVLPLTQRPLHFRRRLGTRHRAAVGLSEISDTLVVVVSEETREISVARDGQLYRPLDSTGLRKQLLDFYVPTTPSPSIPSLWSSISQVGPWLKWIHPRPTLFNVGVFFVSLLLTLIASWGALPVG